MKNIPGVDSTELAKLPRPSWLQADNGGAPARKSSLRSKSKARRNTH